MPLVFREDHAPRDARSELARLRRSAAAQPSVDGLLTQLIDIAEFEAAVVDGVSPDRDHQSALAMHLRALTCEAARVWLARISGNDRSTCAVRAMLENPIVGDLPATIYPRVSEGYAYYGLFPETYAASARAFFDQMRPSRVLAIGVRSIGASLAAVVAAALEQRGCPVSSCTVRPRGHPFAREVRLADDLRRRLLSEASSGAVFAVIDEGPGISGSSFAAVIEALGGLGVPRQAIVLFPSWDPPAHSLTSAAARRVWPEHLRFYTSAPAVGVTAERALGIPTATVDFSAGAWRKSVFGRESDWPAVQPQHERWKVFVPSERRLIKFVGLGRYGHAAATRAARLADLGLAPQPGTLKHGFLDLPFVRGTPLSGCRDIRTANRIGEYIGRVATSFRTGETVDAGPLLEMVETNTRELFGAVPALPAPDPVAAAIELDGRMLAHEWIQAPEGALLKVDGLDHHRDHFFPGTQAAAWDLAAAIIELRMNDHMAGAMLLAFERASGDRTARAHLPLYLLAVAVFRAGYCTMAVDALRDTAEALRMKRAARRYSQCALNATACLTASSKSPRKQIARSSMNT